MTKPRRITYEEQKDAGLIRQQRQTFVAPASVERYQPLPPEQRSAYEVAVPPTATQHIEVRTSAVDRAKGYLIASVPLYGAFAIGVVAVGVLFLGLPLWSFSAFVTLWLSFLLAWFAGWVVTLLLSAEGVAFYEARQKWKVVEREQAERWRHYNRQTGGER